LRRMLAMGMSCADVSDAAKPGWSTESNGGPARRDDAPRQGCVARVTWLALSVWLGLCPFAFAPHKFRVAMWIRAQSARADRALAHAAALS
jgi:hypothetical protein